MRRELDPPGLRQAVPVSPLLGGDRGAKLPIQIVIEIQADLQSIPRGDPVFQRQHLLLQRDVLDAVFETQEKLHIDILRIEAIRQVEHTPGQHKLLRDHLDIQAFLARQAAQGFAHAGGVEIAAFEK